MSEEIIKIKGNKGGLQLTFRQGADFTSIERELTKKLEKGEGFFTSGTVIQIAPDALKKDDRARLKRLFNRYGLLVRSTDPSTETPTRQVQLAAAERLAAGKIGGEHEGEQMVVINRTLRGGQEVKTKSSVLVCGNVNPGAQIIAGGSIDIRGTCRGIVHAGAYGNTKAFIVADRLMPLQIRIANFVARSPDQVEQTDRAEKASIKDGQIIIEPIER